MKTLIFPDVHLRHKALEQLLNAYPADRYVSLGDWFDMFGDTAERNRETAIWLQRHFEKFEKLLGNHDVAYYRCKQNKFYDCCGYTNVKRLVISDHISDGMWKKFRLHVWVDGWLVSHAGVHRVLLQDVPRSEFRTVIDTVCEEALETLEAGKPHWFLGAGKDRCGWIGQEFGGIIWMDWDSLEPIEGLCQLVGHSFQQDHEPKQKSENSSDNFCIDTGLRHFSVIEDGRLQVFKVSDFTGNTRPLKVAV